jgi:DNA modification methylase
VLKPSGSLWVNLGDKYANPTGSGSAGWTNPQWDCAKPAAPQNTLGMGVRQKSLMGLPWRYAIGCIDDLGLILRAEVIWSKPNGLPESVTDRVRRSHEQWFHFTSEPRYFSALDEIREPQKEPERSGTWNGANTGDPASPRSHSAWQGEVLAYNPLGKLPGSVWSIPSEPLRVPDDLGVDHFAAFPQEWPRRLILGWCPAEVCTACGEGRAPVVEKRLRLRSQESGVARGPSRMNGRRGRNDEAGYPNGIHEATITGYACACPDTTAPSTPGVVLDPFAGTGTVPMVARALGRTGIGVDLSSDYLRLASWRVFESGHASKTVARTNGERQGLLL